MAYNPYKDVYSIYKAGNDWQAANNANDDKRKNEIAQRAQQYYDNLRKSGYGDLADELAISGSDRRKEISDYYAKLGKTAIRPYFYESGKKYGMSEGDIDNLLAWNGSTGEVSFGGKKIGKPDSVVDGVSYWSDTASLDNTFNDYIQRSGIVRSKPTAVNQENEGLFEKYNREYEDLKNTNPFETETAKSILAKYDLAGLQGRDNAAASGAGSNGGNIDSFAAANALRQQAALVSQGQQVVLDEYHRKLDHARSLLSDIGVNIDRVYNQDETSKNNDVERKSKMAAVSGYTPAEWAIQNDSFLKNFVDENGKLKPEYNNTDFQELINLAKANGNTELANKYAILRGMKIFGNFSEYGKYLNKGDIAYLNPQRTADYDLTKQQIDSAERISKSTDETNLEATKAQAESNERINNAQIESNERINESKIAGEKDITKINAQNALDQINAQTGSNNSKPSLTAAQASSAVENGEISQSVIDAYNYWFGTSYTVDNPPTASTASGTAASLSQSSDEEWDTFYNSFGEKKKVQNFLIDYIKPLYQNNTEVTNGMLKNLILNNTEKYDIDVDDARRILSQFGADTTWLSGYKNRWGFNSGKGMKKN